MIKNKHLYGTYFDQHLVLYKFLHASNAIFHHLVLQQYFLL